MSERRFYIMRVWFDALQRRSRGKFLTMSGGWTNDLGQAQEFAGRESARRTLHNRSGSIFTEEEIREGRYWP